jgi:predicted glycoside hydrolase/deacetylase ChbG (UPF0249 family)
VSPIRSSELLGYPPEARVLIVNCDDFGMSDGINTAVIDSIENGIARSCSLMVPCPAAPAAMRLLRERPAIPFGIHLTLVRDSPHDRWAPLATVPSLLDDTGELFTSARRAELMAQARIDEVELEFRAQIDAVAPLVPTHLDFHCLADGGRADIFDVATELAGEYGLAVRVWLAPGRRKTRGLPVTDNNFLDSFVLDIDGKAARYAQLLRDLPAGLNEWAVHPGRDGDVRRTDHEFLTSPQARELIGQEGIVMIDYRPVREVWASAQ